MARYDRAAMAERWTAQEARKDARAGDSEFAQGTGRARFQQGAAVIDTDQTGKAAADGASSRTPCASLAASTGPTTPDAASPQGRGRISPGQTSGTLNALCRGMHLPEPIAEHQFCTYRRWRFDYAWPAHMLALEVEGGIWTQGRHTRGAGALADLEKYSEAAILGWRILYCTPDDLMTLGIERVRKALKAAA